MEDVELHAGHQCSRGCGWESVGDPDRGMEGSWMGGRHLKRTGSCKRVGEVVMSHREGMWGKKCPGGG